MAMTQEKIDELLNCPIGAQVAHLFVTSDDKYFLEYYDAAKHGNTLEDDKLVRWVPSWLQDESSITNYGNLKHHTNAEGENLGIKHGAITEQDLAKENVLRDEELKAYYIGGKNHHNFEGGLPYIIKVRSNSGSGKIMVNEIGDSSMAHPLVYDDILQFLKDWDGVFRVRECDYQGFGEHLMEVNEKGLPTDRSYLVRLSVLYNTPVPANGIEFTKEELKNLPDRKTL